MAVTLVVSHGGRDREAEIAPEGDGYVVAIGTRRAEVRGVIGSTMRVVIDRRPVEARVHRRGSDVVVDLEGTSFAFRVRDARAPRLARRGGAGDLARGELHAPMPGLVIEVLAKVGDRIEAGQPLVVVEAMKMQNELTAPLSGRVTRIAVAAGTPVESGQLLAAVAPETVTAVATESVTAVAPESVTAVAPESVTAVAPETAT